MALRVVFLRGAPLDEGLAASYLLPSSSSSMFSSPSSSRTTDNVVTAITAGSPVTFSPAITSQRRVLARVEWQEARNLHVITPSTDGLDSDAFPIRVNGILLKKPTELPPFSRLAIGNSLFFLCVVCDGGKTAMQVISVLLEKATMATHLAFLRRRVLLSLHKDKMALRVLLLREQISRLQQELSMLQKQITAYEARLASGCKELRSLRGRVAELQDELDLQRKKDCNQSDEIRDVDGGETKESVVATRWLEIKRNIKENNKDANGLEITLSSISEELAQVAQEAQKTELILANREGEMVELSDRMKIISSWSSLIREPLTLTTALLSAQSAVRRDARSEVRAAERLVRERAAQAAGATEDTARKAIEKAMVAEDLTHAELERKTYAMPSRKDILDELGLGSGFGDVDERPICDAVFSDPSANDAYRWLCHLLIGEEMLTSNGSAAEAVVRQELLKGRPITLQEARSLGKKHCESTKEKQAASIEAGPSP